MTPSNDLIGIILAGGQSRRMGQDKSQLLIGGQPMYQLIKSQMCQVGLKRIYLSCRPDQMHLFSDIEIVPDQLSDMGPLSGILTILHQLDFNAAMVLACDQPYSSLEALLGVYRSNGTSVLFSTSHDDRLHPFPAIYTKSFLEYVDRSHDSMNNSLTRLIKAFQGIERVPIEKDKLINLNDADAFKDFMDHLDHPK